MDAVNSWGGGHGRDSHTEWQVTTNHTTPLPEKSQSQSGNGFGNENDNHIKVVLVGAPGVGKTSMVQVNSSLYSYLIYYENNYSLDDSIVEEINLFLHQHLSEFNMAGNSYFEIKLDFFNINSLFLFCLA